MHLLRRSGSIIDRVSRIPPRRAVLRVALAACLTATTAHAQDGLEHVPPVAEPATTPAVTERPVTAPAPEPTAAPRDPPAVGTAADTARNEGATAGAPTGAAPAPEPQATRFDLLTFYKDNYFITGFTGTTEVKFQFSAKFDLWPNDGPHALHLAYTQKSLWSLYRRSAPFVESNYNPELFYTFFHHVGRYEPPPGCAFFHERAGLEHESNGQDAPGSRGWNRVFVESRFACYSEARAFAIATLQVWAPPFGAADNPEITRYLGYGQLGLSVGREHGGWFGDTDVTVYARKGTSKDLGVGSVEVDGRWRPPYGTSFRFTPYVYAQFFTGYGETLLAYDRSITNVRIGIGLSDTSARSK